MYVSRSWKVVLILILSFLVLNLGYLESLRAQIQEDEIDFQVLAAVTYKKADTLWKLADKYYGDPRLWPIIAYLNRVYDSKEISAGVTIYIPAKTAKKPTNRIAMGRLSAEIAELKKEILSANEKKKTLETTNEKSVKALEEKKVTIDNLSAEIVRLRTELPRVDEEREASPTEDEHSAEVSTNGENVIKRVEPVLDQTDVEPEKIEVTAKSDETAFNTETPEIPPPTNETGRNPTAGKWQFSLALVAAMSLLLSLIRVF